MENKSKTRKDGLLRTILEDHRKVALYERALVDILFLINSKEKVIIPLYDDEIINIVINEISKLKDK